jgi:anthranilate synthase/aminodeoxychorismate synthase-like glutamine amidotransferase
MIVLIDNYDSFTYNLVQYLGELNQEVRVKRNDRISVPEIERDLPTHVVISPGPGRPETAGITMSVIKNFAGKIPILGVCLGHQAIGCVFGGEVVRASKVVHGKSSQVFHDGASIFKGLSSPFNAGRYHSLIVDRKTLPRCLLVSAETSDGIIMGLRHREHKIEGVQFHPESILTAQGKTLLANFLEL